MRETSPFDSVFEDGALDSLPEDMRGLKNWILAQKDGLGLEKGLRHMQKLASSKGEERPAEDATDEVKEAFAAKLRKLNGVPEKVEDYELKLPEGATLPDEILGKLKEFGVTEGIPPEHINKLMPLQVALQKQTDEAAMEAHVASEEARGDKYFGGEGAFDAHAPVLAKYAETLGYDVKNDPAFRNATTYKLLADLRKATGEDRHVAGDPANTFHGGMEALDKQIDEVRGKLGSNNPAERQKAQAEYIRLNKLRFGSKIT